MMNSRYWIEWARERGRHHYRDRFYYETAELNAPCVSHEPELQAAFIEGWKEEEGKNV